MDSKQRLETDEDCGTEPKNMAGLQFCKKEYFKICQKKKKYKLKSFLYLIDLLCLTDWFTAFCQAGKTVCPKLRRAEHSQSVHGGVSEYFSQI